MPTDLGGVVFAFAYEGVNSAAHARNARLKRSLTALHLDDPGCRWHGNP